MAPWCNRHHQRPNPTLGFVALCLLLVAGAQPALAEMDWGTYTGNGTTQSITGLGFQPAVVIVKGDWTNPAVIRCDYHAPGFSKQMLGNSETIAGGITSFDADGFTVGNRPAVNRAGTEITWVAFSDDPGTLKTGWYFGDGTSDQWITGVGFQPEVVFVIPHDNEPVQFRTIDMPDGFGTSFDAVGLYTDHIEYFASDVFRVGSDVAVNGFGRSYGYLAFNANAAKVVHGVYTGTGVPHDIGPLGFGPDYVIVKSAESKPGVHRSKGLNDPWSSYFWEEGHYNEGITNLKANDFEVGTSDRVNEPAKDFYYVAFQDVTRFADLELAVIVDDATPDVGQGVVYTFTVHNNGGPDNARDVSVDVALPTGMTFASAVPSTGTYDSGTGVWTVGDLNDFQTETLNLTADVDAGTEGQTLTTTAVISGFDGTDPDGSDNAVSQDVVVNVGANAELELIGSWDDPTPDEGQTVFLSFELWNNGPDEATNVAVSLPLPAGLTFVSASTWWSDWDGGTETWSTASILSSSMCEILITATVDPGTAGSTLTTTATITAADQFDPDSSNNSVDAALTVTAVDLGVTISVDDPTPDVGQDITYYVDLVNNGPDVANGITVDLTYPAGLSYQSNTRDSGNYNGGQSRWEVPSLGVGASTQLRLVMRPDLGTGGQTLTMPADIIAADEGDPVGANDSDSVDVVVNSEATADLQLTVIWDDPTPNVGQLVMLDIRLDNFGPDLADNITTTALLPAGITFTNAIPGLGTYDSGTGEWALATLWNGDWQRLRVFGTVDAGMAGATLSTTPTITGAGQFDPDGANNSDTASLTVNDADLDVSMSVDIPAPAEGQDVTVTVDLVNNGPVDATGIRLDLTYPAGLSYQSETHDDGSYNGGQTYWTVPSLAAGIATQIRIVLRVDAGTAGQTLTTSGAITLTDQSDGDASNNSASVDVTVSATDLQLAKVVDNGTPDEGDTVVYTVTLTNAGPDDATGVVVNDLLPAGVTFVSDTPSQGSYVAGTGVWTVGGLTNGASATLGLTATVDAGTGGSTITNTAGITASDQADPVPANDTVTCDIDVNVSDTDLALTKIVDDGTPDEGGTVVYTVTLNNNGPLDATGITVTDLLPAGVSYISDTPSQGAYVTGTGLWTVGDLTNGASATLDITATVDAGTGGSTITNNATITAVDQTDPVPANDTASVDITVTSADLQLAKVVDDGAPQVGDTVTYTVTVNNLGPDTATGIAVVDLLPAGVTYVSDTPSQGSYVAGTGIWTVGGLANAASATLDITATVDAGTEGATITNSAAITGVDQADPVAANDTDSADIIVGGTDLQLTKIVDVAAPDEGGTVIYTLTVTNLGPTDAAAVTVTDLLPAGVTYVSDTPSQGGYVAGTGLWTVGAITDGASATLGLTATVDAGTGGSTITNAAAITGSDQLDPVPANDTDTADVTVTSADLQLSKVVDNGAPNEGDIVTYTITVTNAGPSAATGITVTDLLPAGVTYVSDTPSQGGFIAGTGLWTVGGLANAASATLTLAATVDAGTGGATITNSAAITAADQADPDAGNNTADIDIDVANVADLGLAATFDISDPLPGDAVILTVVVTNAGPDAATGVQIDVSLAAGLLPGTASVNAGSWNAVATTWALPILAPAASQTLELNLTVDAVTPGTVLAATAAVAALNEDDQNATNDAATASLTVRGPTEVSVVVGPFAEPERALLPGGVPEDILYLDLINDTAYGESLTALTLANPITDVDFDQATQDAIWTSLELWQRDNAEPVPAAEMDADSFFSGGWLTFDMLDIPVAAGDTLHLVVRGAVSVNAPDGLLLRPEVNAANDLVFSGPVTVQGTWPLTAPGSLAVNGMTAAQIALHNVDPDIFQIGSTRNLALDVTLPANGGTPDQLIKLNVVNLGSAGYPNVITRVEAWADNGNGAFDPAVDERIGELRWTGGHRFEASSLSQPVGITGQRVFVTVDVAEDALGGSIRLSLPAGDDVGVGMLSGNDGPIDEAVSNPFPQNVSATDRVIITTAPLPSRPVAPGEDRLPVLHLVARNLYTDTRTVNQIRVRNVTVGDAGATQLDLDGAIAQLVIQRDGDNDGELDSTDIDSVMVSTTWENGVATFEGARWILEPDSVSHLFVTASVGLEGAADGDTLGAVINAAGDLQFREPTIAAGDWPLDSDVRYRVNGMVAEQVACPAVPPVSLTANEGPVLAFDIIVPSNGYLDDTLQSLRLANIGTATPADIGQLSLYDDQNDNGIFEPGTDPLITNLAGIGQDWVALDVDLAIPAGGRRLFTGLTVAATPTDSATVRLSVPTNGLDMASANDGPWDDAVTSPTSLLMSTAPLLSNITFDVTHSTTEMTVTATMRVQNVGGEDVVDITPRDVLVTGDGSVSPVSGPVPASFDLAQGAEGTFTWVFSSDNDGPVFLTARCEGTSAIGGQPRGSLASASAAHVVLQPAQDLDLYPVANMPFSINRGQTGVVPMTLTLLNGGGSGRANLRLEQLVVTLDDGDGNPVAPADLLSHVTVNEGVNVYCDRWDLETGGQTMTLALDPPVVVTDSEPVTLGLRLDILSNTTVSRFRVILENAGDLTVVDNVSDLPRTVQLDGETFPVMSATGSIVSQATGVVVSAPVQPDLTAGAGQDDVSLLRLELTSSGDDSASEVKVGGFSVTITDTLGQVLPDPSAHLSRLWVEGPLSMHAAHDLTGPADSLVTFQLLPQVTVPVGAPPVALTVHGKLPDDPVLGPLQIHLEPTSTFDARDGNNAADVLVTYQPAQIDGSVVTVQNPAPPVLLTVTGELPPVISLGTADVLAMTMVIEHPGPVDAAAVSLDSLRIACLDIHRQPQDPTPILDDCRVFWNGEELVTPVIYEQQHFVIPLGDRVLTPLSQASLELRVDIEAAAPAGGFELVASNTCLIVRDLNLGSLVPLLPAPGRSLPASSGLARLQPPSDDVVAGWLDRLPPLLPTGDMRVEALRLVLTNPAPVGAAPVELSTLVLHAADRNGAPLAAGAMLSGVTVEIDGDVWADLTDPVATDSTLSLDGVDALTVPAGGEVTLVVSVSGRAGAEADGLSLGILDGDVVCVQPGSTSLVAVRPAAGQAFPFWTAASGLGAAALADSYINFPNPFAAGRDETRFAFNLAEPATVSLRIWTPRGESVTTLLSDAALAMGLYQDIAWDGRNGRGQAVRNGVYVAELKVQYESGGSERLLRKVAVVR